MLVHVLLSLIAGSILALLLIRRLGMIAPLSIFAAFNMLCLFYFFYTKNLGILPAASYSVMPLEGLEQASVPVANFFLFLNVLAYGVGRTVPRPTGEGMAAFKSQFALVFATPAVAAFLAVLGVMTAVHFIDFDRRFFWEYRGYHTINDLETVRITNPVAAFYHSLGPTLAAVAGSMAVACLHTRRTALAIPGVALALYGLALAVASSSREAAVIVALPTATHYLFRRRFDIPLISGIALAALMVIGALGARWNRNEQGLSHFFDNLGNRGYDGFGNLVISLISNVAEGATSFANAVRMAPSYDFSYIYVSMFSLKLGGYSVVAARHQVMISHANPVGAFGEVYHFGWFYLAILLVILMAVLRSATVRITNRLTLMTLPIYGLTLLLIYRLHHYPMRISQRILILLALFYLADFVLNRRRRSAGASGRRITDRTPGMASHPS